MATKSLDVVRRPIKCRLSLSRRSMIAASAVLAVLPLGAAALHVLDGDTEPSPFKSNDLELLVLLTEFDDLEQKGRCEDTDFSKVEVFCARQVEIVKIAEQIEPNGLAGAVAKILIGYALEEDYEAKQQSLYDRIKAQGAQDARRLLFGGKAVRS